MKVIRLGNRVVNHYLYAIKEGYVLIDTGYEGGYDRFKKQLKSKGIKLEEIAYIFLTHAHDDHAGFLNQIVEENEGAKIVLSEKALPGLLRGQNSFEGGCTTKLALGFCKLMSLCGKGGHYFPSLKEEYIERCLFINNRTKNTIEKLLEARIYETPGHTSCSISLRLGRNALFVGDAAMNGFPSRHKITIWVENREAYYKAWKKITELKVKTIYPSHGNPFATSQLVKNMDYARNMRMLPLKKAQ